VPRHGGTDLGFRRLHPRNLLKLSIQTGWRWWGRVGVGERDGKLPR
jgi:hypothetical protein